MGSCSVKTIVELCLFCSLMEQMKIWVDLHKDAQDRHYQIKLMCMFHDIVRRIKKGCDPILGRIIHA